MDKKKLGPAGLLDLLFPWLFLATASGYLGHRNAKLGKTIPKIVSEDSDDNVVLAVALEG